MWPVWKGDLGFDDAQLRAWQAAAVLAGLVTPSVAVRKKDRIQNHSIIPMPADPATTFVASKVFQGKCQGWFFSTSEAGTGYHRDIDERSMLVRKALLVIKLEDAIPLHTCDQQDIRHTQGLAQVLRPRPRRLRARRARIPDGTRKPKLETTVSYQTLHQFFDARRLL